MIGYSKDSGSKQKVTAVGAAGGIERLIELCEFQETKNYDLPLFLLMKNLIIFAIGLAEFLKNKHVSCDIIIQSGNLKENSKAEAKSKNFIIIGENEIKLNQFYIKNFRDSPEKQLNKDGIEGFY